jgi:beta-xylosidase
MKCSILVTLALLLCHASAVELAIAQDFADPTFINTTSGYIAFSTNKNSNAIHVPWATSPDFNTWTVAETDAMPQMPRWAAASNYINAPDVNIMPNGVYHLYFDALVAETPWRRCIGVATSNNPQGPFQPNGQPISCGADPHGYIDASGFTDANSGRQYLLFKLDGNNPGPNDQQSFTVPTQLYVQELAGPDYLTVAGDPITILSSEDDPSAAGIVEAPSLTYMASAGSSTIAQYVLYYSSGFYQSSGYTVSYATSSTIAGPFTKQGALLQSGDDNLSGPGGATVKIDDDGTARMVFHTNQGDAFNGVRYMWTSIVTMNSGRVSLA